MEWMINTQLGRRNLPPAQRIAVWDKFRKLVEKENILSKSQKISLANKSRDSDVVQLDNNENISRTYKDTSYYTRQQIAQKANVGSGTVARFNKVMNSGDEELKKKVLANEVSINAGYKELTQENFKGSH